MRIPSEWASYQPPLFNPKFDCLVIIIQEKIKTWNIQNNVDLNFPVVSLQPFVFIWLFIFYLFYEYFIQIYTDYTNLFCSFALISYFIYQGKLQGEILGTKFENEEDIPTEGSHQNWKLSSGQFSLFTSILSFTSTLF